MKKVLFCLSLIISLSVLGVVPSFAMDFVIDPATIGSLGDLGYGLAGGMELNFTDSFITSKYKGQYEAAGNSEGKRLVAQAAANDFVTNYAISRGLPLPSNASDYVDNLPTDVYGYFKSVYFDNQSRSIVNKAKLAPNDAAAIDAMRFGIGPSAFADWSEYNKFWYNKYQAIGNIEEPSTPIPNPDPLYINDINYLNLHDSTVRSSFWFYDYAQTYYASARWGTKVAHFPWTDFSYFIPMNYATDFTTNTDQIPYIGVCDPLNIYIYSVGNDLYTCSINVTPFPIATYDMEYSTPYGSHNGIKLYKNTLYKYDVSNTESSIYSFQGTLSSIFNNLKKYFKNVNIYVDNELWADIGAIDNAPANPIIPTFPDVIDPTSDDPAYTIDLPATDTGEGYFDLTSLFDALVDAIEGALDDDPTTDGVLDGTKGLEYEDEAGDAVNDDPIPDDDVIDDSVPDPTGLPNIPVPLPPIQDAFTGTTVLAQLVHATDIVMPDDLMAVFWGIVFILFIIGLIKVLHK